MSLVREVVEIPDNLLYPKISDEEARVIEVDNKFRWLIKYLDAMKQANKIQRLVIIFTSSQ